MNALREIGEFIGMSPGTRLRSASDIVINPGEEISMREVIRRLPNLPPISLEAVAENTSGEVPFRGIVHLRSSTGVVLETHVGLFRNGQLVGTIIKDAGAPATDKVFEVVDPGSYVLEVTRTGITGTGVTQLRKTFDIQGRAKPVPTPPTPHTPPTSLVTCSAELDGDDPGGQGFDGMRIFGGGFLASEPVEIFDNEDLATTTKADEFGAYKVHLSFAKTLPSPTHHTVHAHGQLSGRTSNQAGFSS